MRTSSVSTKFTSPCWCRRRMSYFFFFPESWFFFSVGAVRSDVQSVSWGWVIARTFWRDQKVDTYVLVHYRDNVNDNKCLVHPQVSTLPGDLSNCRNQLILEDTMSPSSRDMEICFFFKFRMIVPLEVTSQWRITYLRQLWWCRLLDMWVTLDTIKVMWICWWTRDSLLRYVSAWT